jgi:hypothetical protein
MLCISRFWNVQNELSNGSELDYHNWSFPYQDLDEHSEDLPLLDPSSPNTTVGSITISCYIEVSAFAYLFYGQNSGGNIIRVLILFCPLVLLQDPVETEQSFARRVLAIVVFSQYQYHVFIYD